VTMFYAQVDTATEQVTYVNAGHDPPLVIHDDGAAETLEVGGLVLGVLRDARYEEGRVRLGSGETMVLYTDGAVEALDAAGEEFGAGRLREAARAAFADASSADEAAQRILAQVEHFARGGQRRDDITIMVVRAAGTGNGGDGGGGDDKPGADESRE